MTGWKRRLAVAALASVLGTGAGWTQTPPAARGSILVWTPAQQAYGYRNMEKLVPTKVVKKGPKVRYLPRAEQEIDPTFTVAGKTWTVADYMAAHQVSGLLVIRDGKIVLERYGLGRSPTERWTSFSVAKSVTSTLVGAAIADGHIKSLDDPVTRYIPELKGGGYDGVNVRQLITMSSGVKWNEDYQDLNSDVARVGLTPGEPGMNPVVSYMRRLPREAAPGSKFVYNTGQTDLAGILVSNAVGKPLSQYLSEKIWAPFGMEQDAIWIEDAAGHERGGCCMSMTLRDYGRVGLFMLEGGKAGGRRVVPAGWVADATRPHVAKPGYGYFWWMIPGGYEAEGIFGQSISIFPAERMVVVHNAAWPHAWNDELDAPRMALLAALRAAK
jgi:CubicO group peptidase (beta-lactamase class C family)